MCIWFVISFSFYEQTAFFEQITTLHLLSVAVGTLGAGHV